MAVENNVHVYSRGLPILILVAVFVGGCATDQEVVDSWRGYPIEAVIAQWGSTKSSTPVKKAASNKSSDENREKDSIEEGGGVGARYYEWSSTDYRFKQEYTETVTEKRGDKLISRTRHVPAEYWTETKKFVLKTDDHGLVVSGYSHDDSPLLGIYAANNGKWGKPRRE